MSLPGKTMKIGGYNYHVSDQGAGDKVAFLVHGMPDDGSCWKYQAPVLLKAGYRVIVPDTLGYGGTDRPVEVEHYKVEKIIDHMFEIIDTLGLKDINLMGHDWGSAITWPMVLKRPELFRKLISISVGHLRNVFGQAHETPERMYECCMRNWYPFMTANVTTPCTIGMSDLSKTGPVVVDIPPGNIYGVVNNAWMQPIKEINSGKLETLLLAGPGQAYLKDFKGEVIQSDTFMVLYFYRVLGTGREVKKLRKAVKAYRFFDAANPTRRRPTSGPLRCMTSRTA